MHSASASPRSIRSPIPLTVVLLHFLVPGPADRSPWVLLIEVAGIYVFSAFWLVKSREIAILERQ